MPVAASATVAPAESKASGFTFEEVEFNVRFFMVCEASCDFTPGVAPASEPEWEFAESELATSKLAKSKLEGEPVFLDGAAAAFSEEAPDEAGDCGELFF